MGLYSVLKVLNNSLLPLIRALICYDAPAFPFANKDQVPMTTTTFSCQGLDIEGAKQQVKDKIRDKIGGGLRGLTDRLKD